MTKAERLTAGEARANRKNAIRLSAGDRVFKMLCMALLGAVTLIILYPIWFLFIASFSDPLAVVTERFVFWPRGFTLNAYELAFRDGSFLVGLRNSVGYTAVGTAVNLVMTIIAGFPLSKRDLKGRTFLTILFTIPMFFGGGLIPTFLLVSDLGLRNNFWVMIIPSAVNSMYIFLMRTYFQTSIPSGIEDAAQIDGCSHIRYLISILLPLCVPIIAVLGLYYGVGHWNDYFTALVYITKKELYPLQYVLRSMLLQNMDASSLDRVTMDTQFAEKYLSRVSLKYSLMVLSTIPVFAIFPVVQRYFSKGVIVGSIKG